MKITRSRVLVLSALALASAQAFADGASVYALLDGGVASANVAGKSTTEFITGGQVPNFVGVKFEKSEGGLKYGVQLEQGFQWSNPNGTSEKLFAFGNGDLLNRQKNIFISGAAGTFVIGTQPNIAFNTVLMADPHGAANYGSSLTTITGKGSLSTVDNASLSYTSPAMSGVTVSAQLVPVTTTTASTASSAQLKSGSRAAVAYTSGNLSLGLSAYSDQFNDTATGSYADGTGTVLGASYKLDNFTFKAISASQKTNTFTSALTTNGIGGVYSLNDKVSFDLGVYSASSSINSFKLDTTAVAGYYKLAKDLKVYAQYATVENKGTITTDWNFLWQSVAPTTLDAGKKADVLNVGLIFSYF